MQIRQFRLPLWIFGIAAAFLLFTAGKAFFYFYIENQSGLGFLGDAGVPPVVVATFLVVATFRALGMRNEIMLEFSDDSLNYLTQSKQRITIPYGTMREAGIEVRSGSRWVSVTLCVITDDGQQYRIKLNYLAAGQDEVFAELTRRLPGMKPVEKRKQWLVRK